MFFDILNAFFCQNTTCLPVYVFCIIKNRKFCCFYIVINVLYWSSGADDAGSDDSHIMTNDQSVSLMFNHY